MKSIQELEAARNALEVLRDAIMTKATREKRSSLYATEAKELRTLVALIDDVDDQIDDWHRSGRGNPEVRRIVAGTGVGSGWATRAADVLRSMGGESRAVVNGTVDVPSLVSPSVVAKSRPERLVDLLVNRESAPSNAIEYFRQTVRTNNAAPVADLATKPTSTFTSVSVEDRCRVIAHTSEEVPIRLWQDAADIIRWLEAEMVEGVLDALESQVISGSGTSENMLGLLNVAGTTAVAYNTSVPVTLRKAITALQTIGVKPNAWVLNPADVEAIDLLRFSIDPAAASPQSWLLDGYTNGVANSANIFGDASIARVASNSVPAGTAILGDWSQIRLYVREGVQLDVDRGGELFKKNAAILRAEMRAISAVLRPASFAKVDLTP